MEVTAYITSIAAGVFYLVASARLFSLSRRTCERPEFLLGIYFAATGQWYALYNTPFFFGFEALPPLLEYGVEWVYVVGVVPYLLFIRCVFRAESSWATALVVFSMLFLLGGALASSLGGGFSNAIGDPSFYIEFIGYTVPCVWMCCEGFVAHASARKRAQLKLCDPIVANRYLLFGCFGLCQTAGSAAELLWAYGNSTGGAATAVFATGLLSLAEIAAAACLWLAFFPPVFYRRWFEAHTDSSPTPAEEG
jgi:hypothetical protein